MSARVFLFVIGILFGGAFGSAGAIALWGKTGLGWSCLCIAGVIVVVSFSLAVAASIEGDDRPFGWARIGSDPDDIDERMPPDPFEDDNDPDMDELRKLG